MGMTRTRSRRTRKKIRRIRSRRTRKKIRRTRSRRTRKKRGGGKYILNIRRPKDATMKTKKKVYGSRREETIFNSGYKSPKWHSKEEKRARYLQTLVDNYATTTKVISLAQA